jgi:hypothetical protein
MGREGFVCFDGGRGNEGEARAVGRPKVRVIAEVVMRKRPPHPLLSCLLCRWPGLPACRERESDRARERETRKRVVRHFLDPRTIRTIPSTHTTTHRGRPTLGATLSFSCAPLQDLIPLWICYGYHPPHSLLLLSSGIPGLRTPPRTKTHRTTPTFSRTTK